MAIAGALLQGLVLFSDVGIGPSIIQNVKGHDRRFLDTAFTIQCARGVLLMLASTLAAWPFAMFYEEPRLFGIVAVVGATSLVQGFNSTKIFTVGRNLDLKRLTAIELVSQVAGAAAMIGWALVSPSYWALAVGALVSPFVKAVLSHVAIPGPRDRFDWDPPSARALAQFGRWIFVSTLMAFLAGQSDQLIFAKLIPIEMLGVYSMAAMVAMMPPVLFGVIEHRVVFPVYSAMHRDGEPLAPAFKRVRKPFMVGSAVICASLIAAGPALVDFMYDDRYREAGWMIQVLMVGTWLNLLEMTYGAVHLATGRAKWVAAASFAKVIGIVLGVTIGHHVAGFVGAVVGFSLSELARYVVLATGGRVMKLPGLAEDLLFTGATAATGVGGLWVGGAIGTAGYGPFWQTLAIVAFVGSCWSPWLFQIARSTQLGLSKS